MNSTAFPTNSEYVITVCFKIVADFSMLNEHQWQVSDDHALDTSFVRQQLSTLDEGALELALQLADQAATHAHSCFLRALTVAEASSDRFLKHCLALNYQHAVRIDPQLQDLRFNPQGVASVLAGFFKKTESIKSSQKENKEIIKKELIVLGEQSDEGQNGQTAMLLAEQLEWPCITNVCAIHWHEQAGQIDVHSLKEGRLNCQRIRLPAVIALGYRSDQLSLRIPTLKEKLQAAKKEIEHLQLTDCIDNSEPLSTMSDQQLTHLVRPLPAGNSQLIEGETVQEKADNLYEQHIKARLIQ